MKRDDGNLLLGNFESVRDLKENFEIDSLRSFSNLAKVWSTRAALTSVSDV